MRNFRAKQKFGSTKYGPQEPKVEKNRKPKAGELAVMAWANELSDILKMGNSNDNTAMDYYVASITVSADEVIPPTNYLTINADGSPLSFGPIAQTRAFLIPLEEDPHEALHDILEELLREARDKQATVSIGRPTISQQNLDDTPFGDKRMVWGIVLSAKVLNIGKGFVMEGDWPEEVLKRLA